jgi:flagellar basal-body rod protein FlgC
MKTKEVEIFYNFLSCCKKHHISFSKLKGFINSNQNYKNFIPNIEANSEYNFKVSIKGGKISMSFLSALNISGSALTAQRLRLDIVSENISNIDTTRTENGEPYRRKVVQFQALDSGDNFKTALGRAVANNSERSISGLGRNIGNINPNFALRKGDAGVIVSQIIEDQSPFKLTYNPTHPDADEYGYLRMPNVDLLQEVVDSMSASRSYEANVTALNSIKTMASKALEVGR